MIDVNRDFSERVAEIELYFSFMENVMIKNAQLLYPDSSKEAFATDLNKILKANSFLLLYNLAESCIKNAVEQIYITLDIENISYDDLHDGIKNEIVKYLKSHVNTEDFVKTVGNIASGIILKCFDAKKLLSGNLDVRKLRTIARQYGFSTAVVPIINSDGSKVNIDTAKLLIVKTRRNDLSHGFYSFKECGKEYTIQDLINIKNHVIEYLKQILCNIESYILRKEYLLSSSP